MISTLNDSASKNIAKLCRSSMLTINDFLKSFNLTSYRLKQIKEQFEGDLNLSDKDWIYGALRTLTSSTVQQIAEYIDYKNRVSLTSNEIINGLKKLRAEGLIYNTGEKWIISSRFIEVYKKDSNEFISEVELGIFYIDKFREVFKPNNEDYLMYELFKISESEVEIINGLVSIEFSFDQCDYFLTCRQGE